MFMLISNQRPLDCPVTRFTTLGSMVVTTVTTLRRYRDHDPVPPSGRGSCTGGVAAARPIPHATPPAARETSAAAGSGARPQKDRARLDLFYPRPTRLAGYARMAVRFELGPSRADA